MDSENSIRTELARVFDPNTQKLGILFYSYSRVFLLLEGDAEASQYYNSTIYKNVDAAHTHVVKKLPLIILTDTYKNSKNN